MNFELEEQDGVYFLDVYYADTLKEKARYPYGTIIFDTKRKNYYLIPSEKSKLEEIFISLMENIFLVDLVPKNDYGYPKFSSGKGSKTGDLSFDVQEKLIDLFKKYDISFPLKEDANQKYYHLLKEYNKGYYPESKMYHLR